MSDDDLRSSLDCKMQRSDETGILDWNMNVSTNTDQEQNCLNVTADYGAMKIISTFLVILWESE